MHKTYCIIAFIVLITIHAKAQDSALLSTLIDSMQKNKTPQLVVATFAATQIINTPTIESPAKKTLQILIMHRFGKINQGAYELFGLDNATMRFGINYGLTNKLSIGIGRSNWNKVFDASFKLNLLQQTTGKIPFSISLYELLTYTALRYPDKPYMTALYRTAYTSQLLIARKINSKLSLQLSPAWIHYNLVAAKQDKNDVVDVSLGGRIKLTRRMSLSAEYNYLLPNQVVSTKVYNSFSTGLDLETGGHVFQLIFTNSQGIIGPSYLSQTSGRWGKGDVYFGFNISRFFN